ncbi:hypothetical protein FRC00_007511 [Tulasnella sp. 408]|nr:hypothetical protein FRC00_007511 [Tulasnella sp. 408]
MPIPALKTSPEATTHDPSATSSRLPHLEVGSDSGGDQETNGSRRETEDHAAPGPPQKRRRLSSGGTDAVIFSSPSLLQGLLDMVDTFTWALAQEFNSAPLPPDLQPVQRVHAATATSGVNSEPGEGGGIGESRSAARLSAKAKGKRPMK